MYALKYNQCWLLISNYPMQPEPALSGEKYPRKKHWSIINPQRDCRWHAYQVNHKIYMQPYITSMTGTLERGTEVRKSQCWVSPQSHTLSKTHTLFPAGHECSANWENMINMSCIHIHSCRVKLYIQLCSARKALITTHRFSLTNTHRHKFTPEQPE